MTRDRDAEPAEFAVGADADHASKGGGAPEPAMVRPDYGGAWVGGVVAGLAAARRGEIAPWMPTPASHARTTVLLVVDGLGWEMLERNAERVPVLSSLAGGPITTVAPSTTAAALTSITTGVPPASHGVIGYRFRVGGEVLNTLQWRVRRGADTPVPEQVQPVPPFGGDPVPVVSRREFADTGFTVAHLRGARLHGWVTPATIAAHVVEAVAQRPPLVYAYTDGIDKVAHAHGLSGEYLGRELAATDALVAELLDGVPDDVAVVVTADHGHVEVDPADHYRLGRDLGELLSACAGEARFRSLYARAGAARELAQAVHECYGHLAWIRTREELIEEGWLGDGIRPTITGRVGDVVLAPHEPVAFIDPSHEREAELSGMHGSLTRAEMLVPLLAGRGRRSP